MHPKSNIGRIFEIKNSRIDSLVPNSYAVLTDRMFPHIFTGARNIPGNPQYPTRLVTRFDRRHALIAYLFERNLSFGCHPYAPANG